MFDKGQKQSSMLSCDSSYWSYFPLIIFDTISCPLYNLKTVKDFSMKLGTLVNHDETMCHAQEP